MNDYPAENKEAEERMRHTKKIGLTYLLSVLAAPLFALHVECIGTAMQTVVEKSDTVFVFAGEIGMRTTDGSAVDWYKTDGTLAQSNAAEIYPDDGGYYIEVGGQKEYFYLFSYPNYAPSNLSLEVAEANCQNTQLRLQGTLPEMQYRTAAGQTRSVPRTCSITYSNSQWNDADKAWQSADTTLLDEAFHIGYYTLPDIYQKTDIALCYDQWITNIGLTPDSIFTTLEQPVAVKAVATTITTVRGVTGELSNEVDRPTDETMDPIQGSAPLDVLFHAYGTPTVEYYQWYIYKGTELIVQRTDDQHRYTFLEPGSYRAVLYVSNPTCPCADGNDTECQRDSVEKTIAVSESQLLVPNVFTPNGDGKNDEFRVLYRSLKEFHCWVYNRWGKLVYEWTDPAKGWDGTINGKPAAEGAYFYVIRALGTDATSGYSSKIKYDKAKKNNQMIGVYQLSGDINLLR